MDACGEGVMGGDVVAEIVGEAVVAAWFAGCLEEWLALCPAFDDLISYCLVGVFLGIHQWG